MVLFSVPQKVLWIRNMLLRTAPARFCLSKRIWPYATFPLYRYIVYAISATNYLPVLHNVNDLLSSSSVFSSLVLLHSGSLTSLVEEKLEENNCLVSETFQAFSPRNIELKAAAFSISLQLTKSRKKKKNG